MDRSGAKRPRSSRAPPTPSSPERSASWRFCIAVATRSRRSSCRSSRAAVPVAIAARLARRSKERRPRETRARCGREPALQTSGLPTSRGRIGSFLKVAAEAQHVLHVLHRFAERRDATEASHRTFARVVCSENLLLVSAELVRQVFQVLRAGGDVLRRIEQVLRAHPPASRRQKLHEADRARARTRFRIELRLLLDHRRNELRRNA